MSRVMLLLAVVVLCHSTAGCVLPKYENLAKYDSVPEGVARHTASESRMLVLPLWNEDGGHRFRDPYIVPVSAIGTPEASVPRRMGFYLDSFVCGGPSKYVMGYLIVTDSGRFVWSGWSGERVSDDSQQLVRELENLFVERTMGPGLKELTEFGDPIKPIHSGSDSRIAAQRFLSLIDGS